MPASYLEAERSELVEWGIFRRVPSTCSAVSPSAARYTNPRGEEELLVSLNAINTEAGCWVIITSSAAADLLGTGIGRPYKETPAVRLAVAIYLLMAKLLIPSQGSSTVYEKEYEGKTGVVTETIPAEGIGAVALTVRGSRSVVSARGTGNKIPIGTEVLIKRVADAVATVEEVRQP